MSHEILMIISISFIIFISPLISRLIRLPSVTIEIALGSALSFLGVLYHNKVFELVAELGFLYLMFLAGLELDLKQILKIPKTLIKKALLYIVVLYACSVFVTFYFSLAKIFIVVLPLISVGLLASLKKEFGEKEWIKLGITVGLLGEVVSIITLTTISAWFKFGFSFSLFYTLFFFVFFILIMAIFYKIFHNIIWWYPKIKNYLMPHDDVNEQDIRLSMAIFFILVSVMIYLGLELALGAFVAGSFIATFFEHNSRLPAKLEHFGFGWLVPIFFISVGSSFDLSSIFAEKLFLSSLYICFAMIFIRLLASLIFLKELKRSFLLLGLSHAMPLSLLIAIATLAFQNKSISSFYYYAFIQASVLEVLICMALIKAFDFLYKQN